MFLVAAQDGAETRSADARTATEHALTAIHEAAVAEAQAQQASNEASRLSAGLTAAHASLATAQQNASDAEKALQELYQHLAALRTMQRLAKDIEDVRSGALVRERGSRAKRRQVSAAEDAEKVSKGAFDASAQAFKDEQEAVAARDTAVRKAAQVQIEHRLNPVPHSMPCSLPHSMRCHE